MEVSGFTYRPYTHWVGCWLGPTAVPRGFGVTNTLAPASLKPRTVLPKASRYIVYTMRAPFIYITKWYELPKKRYSIRVTLANDQLDAQILNTFITILYMYMFRAIFCLSSGRQIILIQHLVSSSKSIRVFSNLFSRTGFVFFYRNVVCY
jgi:hypothetical protein